MPILLVGLNHRTAPVEIREQLALTDCALQMALQELGVLAEMSTSTARGEEAEATLHEGVILSTCNRLEVYARTAGSAEDGWTLIRNFLCALQGLKIEDLAPHLYTMQGEEAVEHLLRVASGLDSMILGEPQILGQVGEALAAAQSAGTTGPILSHLFGHAIHTGKRARTETAISRHTTSVSHAAALLAREKFGDLSQAAVLIVGAGEMAELAIQALQDHGASNLTYTNRTHSRAQAMADRFGGQAVNWYHLDEALAQADIVVTATGAPHTVIYANDVIQALPTRGDRPLMFVDIGVPRDVEESVGELPNVFRYDIDHLQYTVDANMAQREAAIPDVEAIVREQLAVYMEWYKSRQVVPVLVGLRKKAHELADEEIARTIGRLGCADGKCHETISLLVHGVLKRLLHEPTVRLKISAAAGNGYGYAEAIRELFALNAILTESLDEQLDYALTPDD